LQAVSVQFAHDRIYEPYAPAAVHYGRATELHAARARVLEAAYAARPERFVRGTPMPPTLPTAAWINKPTTKEVAS